MVGDKPYVRKVKFVENEPYMRDSNLVTVGILVSLDPFMFVGVYDIVVSDIVLTLCYGEQFDPHAEASGDLYVPPEL